MIHRTPHPPEVREEALRLRATGMPVRKIAARMGLKYQTVQVWTMAAEEQQERAREVVAVKPRPKTGRGGSGVIAPAPYRTNYRWWNGRGEGWA